MIELADLLPSCGLLVSSGIRVSGDGAVVTACGAEVGGSVTSLATAGAGV